jgi:hypothetical protein
MDIVGSNAPLLWWLCPDTGDNAHGMPTKARNIAKILILLP